MIDGLRALYSTTPSITGQSNLNEIEIALTQAQTVLDNVLGEIRELDDNIDSLDEQGIDDMACKVEQMIEDGLYKKTPNQPALDELADEIFRPKRVETDLIVDPTIAKFSKAAGLK